MDIPMYEGMYVQEDGHWWFRGRRAVIRALLDRVEVPPRARVLDAGCGTGRNLIELAALGTAEGVDSSAEAIAFCRKRGLSGIRQATLDALPFEAGSFDVILLADVIEHVDYDSAALRELRRVAAPGALLVITAPAYKWLWSQHDEAAHHRRRYTRSELAQRAEAAGWDPEVGTYFNALLLGPIAAVRRLRGKERRERSDLEVTPGWLNRILELPLRIEAALIRLGVRLPFGVSIGLVCRADASPVSIAPAEASALSDRR